MTLTQYLRLTGQNQADFAAQIGVTQMAVSRYCRGNRVPNSFVMRRIMDATQGAVTANDFFKAQPERLAS